MKEEDKEAASSSSSAKAVAEVTVAAGESGKSVIFHKQTQLEIRKNNQVGCECDYITAY
jgi:hypothetical protein